jgi:hypothetical protein
LDFVTQLDIYRYEEEEDKTHFYPLDQSTVPTINRSTQTGENDKIGAGPPSFDRLHIK